MKCAEAQGRISLLADNKATNSVVFFINISFVMGKNCYYYSVIKTTVQLNTLITLHLYLLIFIIYHFNKLINFYVKICVK